MRNHPKATGPPTTLRAATALVLAATVLSAGVAQAQEKEQARKAKTLQVTSTSPEAVELFWAGLDDALNVVPTRAAERMEEALALDPEFGMARIVYSFYALGMPRGERQTEMARGLESLDATRASTGELLMALALRQWMQGDIATTQKLFATIGDLYPGDPRPAHLYALQTQGMKGINQAILDFQAVTETFPDFGPAYNALAYRLWQTGDHAGAVEAITKYVELMPDHPNAHDSYAEIMQWSGRYDEAIQHYNRANELYPLFAWSAGLAEVHQLMGELGVAREHLAVAIETAPTETVRIQYRLALGNNFLLAGDTQTGLDEFEAAAREAEAVEHKALTAFSYASLAVADAMLGEGSSVESALQSAEDAVGTQAYYYRVGSAVAWAAMGDTERTHAAVQNLDEDQADIAHLANALLFMHQQDAQKAEQELAMADQDDDFVRALLGICYKETGRHAEAMALRDDVLNRRDNNPVDTRAAIARALAQQI